MTNEKPVNEIVYEHELIVDDVMTVQLKIPKRIDFIELQALIKRASAIMKGVDSHPLSTKKKVFKSNEVKTSNKRGPYRRWTTEEKEFVKENYHKLGVKKLSKQLNCDYKQVSYLWNNMKRDKKQ